MSVKVLNCQLPVFYRDMENKKPIKNNHIKEFGGGNARERHGHKLGTSQGHPGRVGAIYVEIHIKGAECPRDRWDR